MKKAIVLISFMLLILGSMRVSAQNNLMNDTKLEKVLVRKLSFFGAYGVLDMSFDDLWLPNFGINYKINYRASNLGQVGLYFGQGVGGFGIFHSSVGFGYGLPIWENKISSSYLNLCAIIDGYYYFGISVLPGVKVEWEFDRNGGFFNVGGSLFMKFNVVKFDTYLYPESDDQTHKAISFGISFDLLYRKRY